MPAKINPFRPGGIAAPGMFAGRLDEVLSLENALLQAASGNPQHFLVRGERGIGKSSLLFYLEGVARGLIAGADERTFHFLVLSLALDRHTTFADIVRRIGKALDAELAPLQRARETLKEAWTLLKRIEAFGIKYADSPSPTAAQDDALDSIVSVATEAVTRLADQLDGILILLDEADKPPASADLGLLLKHLTERLTRARCDRLLIGLAGLPGVVDKLKRSHESAPRIFRVMTLEPLAHDERLQVVRRGMSQAATLNKRDIRINPDAEQWIASFSEGYPHFIQQFAFCAFEADGDDHITVEDVVSGALQENGAYHQLGLKYFEELYFEQIGADQYREVLRAMADGLDGWVTKDELRTKTGLKPYIVNNAVVALKKRNIIVPKSGQSGVYRLPTKSFAVWIKGFTQARTPPPAPPASSLPNA